MIRINTRDLPTYTASGTRVTVGIGTTFIDFSAETFIERNF
jgi:hypothetical protein